MTAEQRPGAPVQVASWSDLWRIRHHVTGNAGAWSRARPSSQRRPMASDFARKPRRLARVLRFHHLRHLRPIHRPPILPGQRPGYLAHSVLLRAGARLPGAPARRHRVERPGRPFRTPPHLPGLAVLHHGRNHPDRAAALLRNLGPGRAHRAGEPAPDPRHLPRRRTPRRPDLRCGSRAAARRPRLRCHHPLRQRRRPGRHLGQPRHPAHPGARRGRLLWLAARLPAGRRDRLRQLPPAPFARRIARIPAHALGRHQPDFRIAA